MSLKLFCSFTKQLMHNWIKSIYFFRPSVSSIIMQKDLDREQKQKHKRKMSWLCSIRKTLIDTSTLLWQIHSSAANEWIFFFFFFIFESLKMSEIRISRFLTFLHILKVFISSRVSLGAHSLDICVNKCQIQD